MSEWSSECQAANRIAAQLRGQTYQRAKAKPVAIPRVRATAVVRQGRSLVTPEAVYAFIVEFFKENDMLPTASHISAGLPIAVQTAHEHLMKLVKLKFIEKNAVGRYRFVREVIQ